MVMLQVLPLGPVSKLKILKLKWKLTTKELPTRESSQGIPIK
jgi:hypothetical protein